VNRTKFPPAPWEAFGGSHQGTAILDAKGEDVGFVVNEAASIVIAAPLMYMALATGIALLETFQERVKEVSTPELKAALDEALDLMQRASVAAYPRG
jgi:hypothetical protein